MALRPLPNEVTKLLSLLDTPLQSTTVSKIHDEINLRIGTLSAPSKMPCHSWSISPNFCNIGAKLAKVRGTPCAVCYAQKGRYVFPNVRKALEQRRFGWNDDADWTSLMAIRLQLINGSHFRWFDAGDLQGNKMYADISEVARLVPQTLFWLPTQERKVIANSPPPPSNLTVRLSSTKLEKIQFNMTYPTSSVGEHSNEVYTCPSRKQQNQCGTCRACWNASVDHIRYLAH